MTETDSPGTDGDDPPLLSVVVVTYNEEDRIQACLDSVLEACESVPASEVVLVDSNSTDRTVELAEAYPITIYRIPSDDLTTPSAGRYVGTQHASGDLVLFVDGDMVLGEPWLRRALDRVRDEDVAAVDGHLDEPAPHGEIRPVDSVRGVALYDADALRSVGGFDPQLNAVEDIHLGYELTTRGHRLERLPEVAGYHPEWATLSDPFRRLRRGYTRGSGQAIRKSLPEPRLTAKHLYRIRHRLVMAGWLGVGLLALFATPAFLAWLVLSALGFAYVVSQLGIRSAISFCVQKLLSTVGLALGLAEEPQPREAFPLEEVELVSEGPGPDGLTQAVDE